MMELISGEAGVLRTALGVVLGMAGIDARVRLYLWSGGVEDAVLPTLNAEAYPVGAQVVVTFLSDRTASGMVLGTVEGLLSWRRVAPPAFAERMQPYLQATAARCGELDGKVTIGEDAFTLTPDDGQGLFSAAVLMADGRVCFVPGQTGAREAVMATGDTVRERGGGRRALRGCRGAGTPTGRRRGCPPSRRSRSRSR